MAGQTPKRQRRGESSSLVLAEQQGKLSELWMDGQGSVWALVLTRDSLQAEYATVLINNCPFSSDIQHVEQLVDAALGLAQENYPSDHFSRLPVVVVSEAEPRPYDLNRNREVHIDTDLQPNEVALYQDIDAAHRGRKNVANPYFVILTRTQTLGVGADGKTHFDRPC